MHKQQVLLYTMWTDMHAASSRSTGRSFCPHIIKFVLEANTFIVRARNMPWKSFALVGLLRKVEKHEWTMADLSTTTGRDQWSWGAGADTLGPWSMPPTNFFSQQTTPHAWKMQENKVWIGTPHAHWLLWPLTSTTYLQRMVTHIHARV